MVDEDKQACRLLADLGFQGGQWPGSYITWEFLEKHPKAMEPGYLAVNWNHIPGLFPPEELHAYRRDSPGGVAMTLRSRQSQRLLGTL